VTDFGKQTWVLKEFLRHCFERKSAEYHALDYVVLSRKRYDELTKRPREKLNRVWIDEASE